MEVEEEAEEEASTVEVDFEEEAEVDVEVDHRWSRGPWLASGTVQFGRPRSPRSPRRTWTRRALPPPPCRAWQTWGEDERRRDQT